MKIIDLLNKIANEEENDLETEFEFDKRIWNFYKLQDSEFCIDGWLLNQNITITKHKEVLEENKIPEKLNLYYHINNDVEEETGETTFNDLCDIIGNLRKHEDTINSIIDYLKSKEKGE